MHKQIVMKQLTSISIIKVEVEQTYGDEHNVTDQTMSELQSKVLLQQKSSETLSETFPISIQV